MRFTIDVVIYFYIFICISLLVFNVLYILRSHGRTRAEERRIRRWNAALDRALSASGAQNASRLDLSRRLRRISELRAFFSAIEPRLGQPGAQRFIDDHYDSFQTLAEAFRRRPAMERAFLAYVISRCRPRRAENQLLPALLLEFLEDSTVYCRENVLRALCALGNAGAVEQALRMFDDRDWYHHNRLIADGLATFAGDRNALAAQLWRSCRGWNENLQIAVVQFATGLSDRMSEPFAEALRSQDAPEEVQFALIRYFGRYPNDGVRPVLLQLVAQYGQQGGPAIAACAALARYPGPDTQTALQTALQSRNWYVRRNAATAIQALGGSEAAYQSAIRAKDRYAVDMLNYVTGKHISLEVNA